MKSLSSPDSAFSLSGLGRCALVAALLALAACGGSGGDPATSRPNIILIMTDDQGWAQVGWHGNDVIETPNLDRLASQSVELTRFYVSPVCAPTRASLMTGRYNYRTGVVDTYLGRAMMHSEEVTLAEMLRSAHYRTGIFGKWHLGDTYPMRPQDQGFDEVLVHNGGGIGQPSDPPGNSYFDPMLRHNGQEKRYQGYCTDIFFDQALAFIESASEQPFFAYIPTNAPHSPYDVPDSYREPYTAKGLDDKDARIYGMIANIDHNVGRLLQRLDEKGLADNTILIFMTDNGPTTQHFTAGLRDQKASVYEGGIRAPFLLRWPGRFEPKSVDSLAAHIDLSPTLLEATSVTPPPDVKFDGVSLMPALSGDGEQASPGRTIYIQSHRGNEPQLYRAFAAITQRFKLVQPLAFGQPMPEDAVFELYDLAADPGEATNVASEHPEEAAKLKQSYEQWFRDVSSTRGYDPPRIFLGTEHENPVVLTRQDWRIVGDDGWGDDSLGFWEVAVMNAGTYDIRVRFPKQPSAGRLEFRLGAAELTQPFAEGDEEISVPNMQLEQGPQTLEAKLLRDGKAVGVAYVDVTRRPTE
ncbi:MAG: arylsulfatase [Bryobacterales bacterium]